MKTSINLRIIPEKNSIKHGINWIYPPIYPPLQRRNSQCVLASVVLKEEIDPDTLQRAVDLTLPRFPASKVALHKVFSGGIWNPMTIPVPFVMPDIINPCMPMLFKS